MKIIMDVEGHYKDAMIKSKENDMISVANVDWLKNRWNKIVKSEDDTLLNTTYHLFHMIGDQNICFDLGKELVNVCKTKYGEENEQTLKNMTNVKVELE